MIEPTQAPAVSSGARTTSVTAPAPLNNNSQNQARQANVQPQVSPEVASPVQKGAHGRAEIEQAVNQLNETAKVFDRKVRFEIDNERNQALRIFIVGDNDEVIRAIPPDEILDLKNKIQDAVGLMFDEKA